MVAEPEGKTVGSVDEDFAVESLTGDVFLLGTHSWRIRHVGRSQVRVEDAHGAQPSLPFWLGEAPGRSIELSAAVSRVREQVGPFRDATVRERTIFLTTECGLDDAAARQSIAYVEAGAASLGAMPTIDTVVAERFFDESGGMQLILHAPFGSPRPARWFAAGRPEPPGHHGTG